MNITIYCDRCHVTIATTSIPDIPLVTDTITELLGAALMLCEQCKVWWKGSLLDGKD